MEDRPHTAKLGGMDLFSSADGGLGLGKTALGVKK